MGTPISRLALGNVEELLSVMWLLGDAAWT